MTDPRIALLDQAAPNADTRRLLGRLDSTEVVVRTSPEQAATALSVVNLVARLIPNARIDAHGGVVTVPPFGTGTMGELAGSLTRSVRATTPSAVRESIVVDVGAGSSGGDLYLWADRWSLAMSPTVIGEVQAKPSAGPAAVAVSALAAGEVLRRVLPELPGVRLSRPLSWNLVDYRLSLAPASVPDDADVNAVLFGAGSVGSSFLYSLVLSQARGRIIAVDNDSLQPRNKLRYPLWVNPARGPKVEWVGSFSTEALTVEPALMTASEWIQRAEDVALAIAAVDNTAARRDIVDLLARTTLNAGVDGLQLHVSSHGLGDGLACVYCPYVDVGDPADQVDVYVHLTGLRRSRVEELLGGQPISQDDVADMTAAGRLQAPDRDLVGSRIVDLARHHLYAQAAARVGATMLAVSAPYVSAMAGALLAAETLKICAVSPHVIDRRIDVDCSGFPTGFTSRPHADTSGRCLCHNPVRRRFYQQRWALATREKDGLVSHRHQTPGR